MCVDADKGHTDTKNTSVHMFCCIWQGAHPALDLENHKGKVTEWLENGPVAAEIKRKFKKFLRTFTDDQGNKHYARVLEDMVLGAC